MEPGETIEVSERIIVSPAVGVYEPLAAGPAVEAGDVIGHVAVARPGARARAVALPGPAHRDGRLARRAGAPPPAHRLAAGAPPRRRSPRAASSAAPIAPARSPSSAGTIGDDRAALPGHHQRGEPGPHLGQAAGRPPPPARRRSR